MGRMFGLLARLRGLRGTPLDILATPKSAAWSGG